MDSTFPPIEFIETDSAVSGITVYKPKPPEAHKTVLNFHCPNCTATTAFSTDDGGLTCSNCGYHDVPNTDEVGRGAEEFEFTVESLERAVHGWGEERKELVCDNCASHVTLALSDLTHNCPFCGSNKVMQMKAVQDVLRPRFVVPFVTTTEQCRQISTQWLQESWLLPEGLTRLGRSSDFVPIYVPAWTFDACAFAVWEAELAYKETGWDGKTQTKWKKRDGEVQLRFDDVVVFGTNKIDATLLQQLRTVDLEKLVTYQPELLAGIQAQAYDVPLEEAFKDARHRMRNRTKQRCKEQITRRHRNFRMELDFQDESWRYLLLPLYIAAYQYGDASYQVIINGQTGAIVGQRPVAWRRVRNWILTLLLPALLVGLISLIVVGSEVPPSLERVASLLFMGTMIYLLFTAVYIFNLLRKANKMQSGEA